MGWILAQGAILGAKSRGVAGEVLEIAVNDVVQLRKGHPCGGDTWRVSRIGADIGLVCTTCGRRIMLDRLVFERRVRKVLQRASEAAAAPADRGHTQG